MAARPELDDAAIRELLGRVIGTTDLEIAPVQTEGMEVQVRRVTSGDQSWCLRLGTSLRSFAKDRWAHQTLGDQLPIPRILDVGQVDDHTAFCLSEWKTGRTLQDLSAQEVARTLPAVFEMWSMINSTDLDLSEMGGAGDFDPPIRGSARTAYRWRSSPGRSMSLEKSSADGNSRRGHRTQPEKSSTDGNLGYEQSRPQSVPSSSWPDDLRSHAERARSWTEKWPGAIPHLPRVINMYEVLIDACPDQRDLVHGDFGCNNMLAADGKITAVLDWEAATIGDPLVDISGRFWATHPPVATCVTQQVAFSDHLLGDLPNYRRRVLCYDLRTGLSEINSALADGDDVFAAWALKRCVELIEAAPDLV